MHGNRPNVLVLVRMYTHLVDVVVGNFFLFLSFRMCVYRLPWPAAIHNFGSTITIVVRVDVYAAIRHGPKKPVPLALFLCIVHLCSVDAPILSVDPPRDHVETLNITHFSFECFVPFILVSLLELDVDVIVATASPSC